MLMIVFVTFCHISPQFFLCMNVFMNMHVYVCVFMCNITGIRLYNSLRLHLTLHYKHFLMALKTFGKKINDYINFIMEMGYSNLIMSLYFSFLSIYS